MSGSFADAARRIAIPVLAVLAAAVAALAFLYRFNTLGGALGGFDNDHFIYLVRTDAWLAGERPLRDFADAELRGAWPALTYAVSAWAQQLGGTTLLPEAYLTAGLLAVAHAVVFLLAWHFSKRWTVAVLAALVAIATTPKLYNYPKVLMLALAIWALRAAVLKPSVLRLGAAALVTAVATLFRHDYGVYIAVALLAALAVRDAGRWSTVIRTSATYIASTAALLLPSAVSVQVYEGIPQYVQNALESVAAERTRTDLQLPQLDLSTPLAVENVELVTYYAFWAVPVVAGIVLAAGLAGAKASRLSPAERGTGAGLLVLAVLVNMYFLRANLAERFGDAAVAVMALAAWAVGASAWAQAMRRSVMLAQVSLLIVMLGAAYVFSDVARELRTSGLSVSWAQTAGRYQAIRRELSQLPPVAWSDHQAAGTLRAARYIAECTDPGDRLLVVGPIHEVPVFARRRFAAGQALFKLSMYTAEAHQQRALAWLERQSVPIVLADAGDEPELLTDYPLVARYVAEKYRDAGTIAVDDEPRFRVLVASDREPLRTDATLGLPCYR